MRRVLFGCALLLSGAAAARAPSSARLQYARGEAAAACPDEGELRRSVAERLGYDPFTQDAERTVSARIDGDGGGLRVDIELRGADGALIGQRSLESPGTDCVELASSTALALAIAVDPLVLSRPVPEPPTTDEGWDAYPEARPETAAPMVATPPQRAPEAVRVEAPVAVASERAVFVGVGALLGMGVAPALTTGGQVHAGLRWPSLQLGLEVRVDMPGTIEVGAGTVSGRQYSAGASVCGHAEWVGACAVVTGGLYQSSGEGFPRAQSVTSPWVTAGGRAFFDIAFSERVHLVLSGEVTGQLARTTIAVGPAEVWQSPPLSLSLGAGLTFHWPS